MPEEGGVEWAVKRLCNNRSRGALRMRAEHVKRWLMAEKKAEKDRDMAGGEETATATETGGLEDTAAQEGAENWTKVVDLVQAAFWE